MKKIENIVIIGGGLSGLVLAYLLLNENIATTIIEASPRLGGRIQTLKGENKTPLELGATWFSDMHPHLISLLDELELKKYPQYARGKSLFQTKSFEPVQEFEIPEAQSPSYRIAGGTQELTDCLSKRIAAKNIKLNIKAIAVKEMGNKLEVATDTGEKLDADQVVLCLPPQLAGTVITFSPELPVATAKMLPTVQTWMAGSIKMVLEYTEPFWRTKGYSGTLFSHSGIVSELYDHTNFEENKFGFTGFLNSGASSYSQAVRKEYVLKQLEALLGKEALKPLKYYDKVWTDDFILSGDQIINRPHQNNGHSLLQESYMNGKLLFSGTESSLEFSGYMEGAIRSAKSSYNKLMGLLN